MQMTPRLSRSVAPEHAYHGSQHSASRILRRAIGRHLRRIDTSQDDPLLQYSRLSRLPFLLLEEEGRARHDPLKAEIAACGVRDCGGGHLSTKMPIVASISALSSLIISRPPV
jgi:hypothetical protein